LRSIAYGREFILRTKKENILKKAAVISILILIQFIFPSFLFSYQADEQKTDIRLYFGKVDKYKITLKVAFGDDGKLTGEYYYDSAYAKYHQTIPVKGNIEGNSFTLKAVDNKGATETFAGNSAGTDFSKVSGEWSKGEKKLQFHIFRDPFDDSKITCEEMQEYPEIVFVNNIDLGSGFGSPIAVDYHCEGSLSKLPFLETIRVETEKIRSENSDPSCSGSIVHAQFRYYYFELSGAGIAPEIFFDRWKDDISDIGATKRYFNVWADENLSNFVAYNKYMAEVDKATPQLIKYYKEKFGFNDEKSKQMAEKAMGLFLNRAAGGFPHRNEKFINEKSELLDLCSKKESTVNNLEKIDMKGVEQGELIEALNTALLHGKSAKFISLLLDNINELDVGWGEGPIFYAVRNQANFELLLKKGADINSENPFGKTPIYYAIGLGDHGMVKYMLEKGAKVNHAYKSSSELEECEYNIKHGKRTPLMHAAQNSDVEMLKLLIDGGANVNAVDEIGFNVLDYAFFEAKTANVSYLEGLGLKRSDNESW